MLEQSIACENRTNVEKIFDEYSEMLYRICYLILLNRYDTEDAIQETFLSYLKSKPIFKDEEHKKAWFITVAQNKCKNIRRYKLKHSHLEFAELENVICNITENEKSIMNMFALIPQKFRTVIVLRYIENFTVKEISEMLKISEQTIRKRINKGKNLLKLEYEV